MATAVAAPASTREDFAKLLDESFGSGGQQEGSVVKGTVVGIEKDVAVIDVVPAAMLVARPCVPGELLMVATAVFDEAHVAAMAGKWVPSA